MSVRSAIMRAMEYARFRVWVAVALSLAVAISVNPSVIPIKNAADSGPTSGLNVIVNERGKLSTSYAAEGSTTASANLNVSKPAGATVRRAILFSATTGFKNATMPGGVKVYDTNVLMGHGTPSGISSYNFWTDVTEVVKPNLDAAAAGAISIPVVEPSPDTSVDGVAIAIIYKDDAKPVETTVSLLFGALQVQGDNFHISLERPFDPADPNAQMQMSLGISYSCQQVGPCGSAGQQYSTIDVNGKRLTSAAGGEDDGVSANGALITIGGEGDNPGNPGDPNATPNGPRSDDELYDLRPFMNAGDTSVDVTTKNPSADDNVFFAAFSGNPPIANIQTSSDKFVYVALGDSYQAGEGAGNTIQDDAAYMRSAYENGSNFPPQTGLQENTYTSQASPGGDACHRALLNYAKINRDKFKPGAQVVLVDRTCSGATIEPGNSHPPIIGKVNQPSYDPGSQIKHSIDRLAQVGLSASDVDLVTVGMGGNDAKFGGILATCLAPGMVKRMLDVYPDSPIGIKWLADNLLSCWGIDKLKLKSDDAIKELKAKEMWAQSQALSAYPNAQVLQLDYPILLPSKSTPDYCGGFQKDDANYARKQGKKIDDAVRKSVQETNNSRLGLVEVQEAFGTNGLCPANPLDQLGNGISSENLDIELSYLMNFDGKGDAEVRGALDALVESYKGYKRCLGDQFTLSTKHCDLTAAQNNVVAKKDALLDIMDRKKNDILAALVAPKSTKEIGFDRSRGLYHPNDRGASVLACNVLSVYRATSSDNCINAKTPAVTIANGQFVGNTPVRVPSLGQPVHVVVPGFAPFSSVSSTVFSSPIPVGTFKADANGVVDTNITLPSQLAAGVHLLNFSGATAGGLQYVPQIPLLLDGRPVGDYTTYVCGFQAEGATIAADTPTEEVNVTINGFNLSTLVPNEDGCVLVHIPSVDQLTTNVKLNLVAKSSVTGKSVTQTIDPIPTVASLWATSTAGDGVQISGSSFSAQGRVHSEGGILVGGSSASLKGGTEYGSTYKVTGSGSSVSPAAIKQAAGQGAPISPNIADYRPGGAIAKLSGYKAIASTQCKNGVWTPGNTETFSGVVYVPCAINLSGSNKTFGATFVAEGKITVSGSSLNVGRTDAGTPSLVSAATGADAIAVTGSKVNVLGTMFAQGGQIRVAGSSSVLTCGAFAQSISISGSSISAPITDRCLI